MDAYFIAKQMADIPLFVFTPVLFMSIYYYMVGLNPKASSFFMACVIAILVVQAAVALGETEQQNGEVMQLKCFKLK